MFRCAAPAFVSAFALACGGPPPDTPSAVILFTPDDVCQADAHHTTITLDATMSSRHLALVPLPPEDSAFPDGAPASPLAYAWQLEGDEHIVTSGSLTSSVLTVSVAGDRPLQVTLTTTNAVGGSARTLRTLPITLPSEWRTRCTSDAMCPGGACTAGACAPSAHCTTDAMCPTCFVCDTAQMGCVPRPS